MAAKPASESASPNLAPLLAVANASRVTAAEVETALAGARNAVRAAQSEHDEADAAYRKGLLSTDEAGLKKLVDAKTAALVRKDRAEALGEALENRLAASRREEEDERRKVGYAEAQRLQKDAVAALTKRYPAICREMIGLLRQLAEADLAVDEANAALPAGVAHLERADMIVRGTAGRPKEVRSERRVDLWCRGTETKPIEDPLQSQVRQGTDGRTGYLGATTIPCTRRSFVERVFLPYRAAQFASPLASTLTLPGFFEPVAQGYDFNSVPRGVLAATDAEALKAAADSFASSKADTRLERVEYEYVPAPVKPMKQVA